MSVHPDQPKAVVIVRTRAEQARLNGAKSQGPVTPEGKANSSRNAVKHASYARTSWMLSDEECSQDFAELLESWFAIFQPANPAEELLVAQAARAEYGLARLTLAEDYTRAQELAHHPAADNSMGQLLFQQSTVFMSSVEGPAAGRFNALSRQTGHYRRQRSSALRTLHIVQATRLANEKSAKRTQEVVQNKQAEVFQAAA